jgi:sec-independent protein translocase protein TatB
MLPGMGGFEVVVIALLALVVVGPKDLPILMRRLARWVNHVRGMAAEFRSSFDEMARQSELDELRREVDALRRGEPLAPLRDAIDPTFAHINDSLSGAGAKPEAAAEPYLPTLEPAPLSELEPPPVIATVPDALAQADPPPSSAAPARPRKPRARKSVETSPASVQATASVAEGEA